MLSLPDVEHILQESVTWLLLFQKKQTSPLAVVEGANGNNLFEKNLVS